MCRIFGALDDMRYRMYFDNLKRRSAGGRTIDRGCIEEVARMYLALSGWPSIVLVVALDDDEPGHHSYTSHSLR